MNLKIFLKGGMISAISVILTLALVYAIRSDFIETKIASRSFANESQDNDFAASFGPTENFLQTGVAWTFFDDYEHWPSSSTYKANDYLRQIMSLTDNGPECGSNNGINFIDINGDGLTDVMFGQECVSGNSMSSYVLFLNVGNNNFEVGYKCVQKALDQERLFVTNYGDCAAL